MSASCEPTSANNISGALNGIVRYPLKQLISLDNGLLSFDDVNNGILGKEDEMFLDSSESFSV